MAPIVDGLEADYGDRVAFQRLNVDEDEGRVAAQTYRVRGHPAIVVLNPQGDVVWARLGVQPRDLVAGALESVLASENSNTSIGRFGLTDVDFTLHDIELIERQWPWWRS